MPQEKRNLAMFAFESVEELRKIVETVNSAVISDEDLERAIAFYTWSAMMLDALGPHFCLAWREVSRTLEMLKTFRENRKSS
jgi:hypothetical protein